jgi:hypothetical protein
MNLSPEVIFYHIEKSAGSSLEVMFYNYFKNIYLENEIYIPPKNNSKHYCLEEISYFEKNNFKVILCHISINDKINNFSEHIKITAIRHPIDRIISHYYYFDQDSYNNISLHCFTEEQLTDYISQKKIMLKRLSGETYDLSIAFNNLKQVNIILIFEKLQDDIIKLNKVLNKYYKINATLELERINVRKDNVKIEQIEKDKEYLILNSHLLHDELLLYNYVCNMNDGDRFNIL